MSLHSVALPGNAALTLPSPEERSKPFTKLPGTELGPGIPMDEKSLEQTQRRLALLSTITPRVERLPNAPGLIHSSTMPDEGLMRQTPPTAGLLTYRVPSGAAVILSG